jgi:hypothetical protein
MRPLLRAASAAAGELCRSPECRTNAGRKHDARIIGRDDGLEGMLAAQRQ